MAQGLGNRYRLTPAGCLPTLEQSGHTLLSYLLKQ